MSTRAITAISDFSSSLGMSSHLSKLPGTSNETVKLESGGEALVLYGVPVFRSGTFRDSMGDENTWTDTHIAEMVSHFQQLSSSGAFDRVPVRCDHYSIFSGGLSNVIGYHDNLRAEKHVSPVDNVEYTYLVADLYILREDAKANIASGLWTKRSAEIGAYRTNDNTQFWPTLTGTAFVDIPAVEGLSFSQQVNTDHRTVVIPEGTMPQPASNDNQNHDQGAGAPATKFRIGDTETSDFAAVQAHIDAQAAELATLREFQTSTVKNERTGFVEALADANKILATQKDVFSNMALKMSPDEFTAFRDSFGESGPHRMLGNYAAQQQTAPAPGTLQADAQTQAADQDAIDAAQVRMHAAVASSPEEVEAIAGYTCFTSLKARHPEATVESVLAGNYS